MEYLKGFSIKPYEITPVGEVIFTDGTTHTIRPNQIQCEGYGYTYNKVTQTCQRFIYNTNIQRNISNVDNKNNGPQNTNQLGSNVIQVNGQNNTTRGRNNHCTINGRDNIIENGVNDVNVTGIGGVAANTGALVIGGGEEEISRLLEAGGSVRQTNIFHLSGVTTQDAFTYLTLNGAEFDTQTATKGEYINLPNNAVIGYEVYITRLCMGGTSGTAGHYLYASSRGSVLLNNTYDQLFDTPTNTTIGSAGGVSGTYVMEETTTSSPDRPSMSIKVAGSADVTNIWSATVTLHELKLTETTF